MMILKFIPLLLYAFTFSEPTTAPPGASVVAPPPPNFFIQVTNVALLDECSYTVKGSIRVFNGTSYQTVISGQATLPPDAGVSLGFVIPPGYSYVSQSERFKVKATECAALGWDMGYLPVYESEVFTGNCNDCSGTDWNQVTIWQSVGSLNYHIWADLVA